MTSSKGFGQNCGEDDKSNTLRAKRGLPRCMPAVSVIWFYVTATRFLPSKAVLRRTPSYLVPGKRLIRTFREKDDGVRVISRTPGDGGSRKGNARFILTASDRTDNLPRGFGVNLPFRGKKDYRCLLCRDCRLTLL